MEKKIRVSVIGKGWRTVLLKPYNDCLNIYDKDGTWIASIYQSAAHPSGIVFQYFPEPDKTTVKRGHGC